MAPIILGYAMRHVLARVLRQRIWDTMATQHPTYRTSRNAGTLGAVVALCLALFVPQVAGATVLIKMDSATITRRSARIVVGTVTAVDSQLYGGGVLSVRTSR
ncbi:MAG TPA: hypothetical protein VIK83_03500 [Coriobacteriia bacterium]